MARSRNIKPGFFTNDDLLDLDFCTRLLFAGLWTIADKEGRLQDRPKKIKIDVFPGDDVDVGERLQALAEKNFIIRYEVDGLSFIQITNWHKHQNPHHTEKNSEIPSVNGGLTVKKPLKQSEPRKHDGGNLADSLLLIPDSLIPDSLNKKPRKRSPPSEKPECPSDVEKQVFDDWLTLRRQKKAPVTATVLDHARKEADKAGITFDAFLRVWCARGSQGLSADWLKPHELQQVGAKVLNKQEALEASNNAITARFLQRIGHAPQ